MEEAFVLWQNTIRSDAEKKKASVKKLDSNAAAADNRNGQTAPITAEILGAKVTVLADTGSDYPAVQRSALQDSRMIYPLSRWRCCRSQSC
jgi:hypothetical protein